MGRPRVVVVGGGFGGLAAVRALRKAPVDVTLIDKRNHHLFQPLLYQVATAALSPSDIAEPLRSILSRQRNVEVMLGEVEAVDLDGRRVRTGDGWVAYDQLIVAVGMRTSYFGNDGWEDHAPGLKTVGDALDMRQRILSAFEAAEWASDEAARRRLLTFVVVGGGPTGVELAGAIREISCNTLPGNFRHVDPSQARVVLVEAGEAVLSTLPEPLQQSAKRSLEDLGVEVRLGAMVASVDDEGVVIGDERLEAGTVLWGAGVRGARLGEALSDDLDRAGRVPVGDDLSLPGHPEVMVVGDLARVEQEGDLVPGVAPAAIQMGQHAAENVLADQKGEARTPFRYVDRGSMATIGRSRAVADVAGLRFTGLIAWLLWVFVHLMTLVGHRNRAVVFVKWAWAWATSDRSSRLLWQGEPRG